MIGILIILVVCASVYYFGFYKKGKINDRDGDLIPDEIEDAVEEVKEEVKEVVKETKRRAKAVKTELKDVVDQVGDVVDAAKGKKRRGRKPKAKK
mgnify:CR=1 FL=1